MNNTYQHVELYNRLNNEQLMNRTNNKEFLPSPDAYKLYQKAALPFFGFTWPPVDVNTVAPPFSTSLN